MTPDQPQDARRGITVSKLFVAIAATAALSTVLLAIVLGFDIRDDTTPVPDRSTLGALIICATAWIGLFFVALNDGVVRRVDESETERGGRFDDMVARLDGISTDMVARLDGISTALVDVSTVVDDFRRQNDKALLVIHDEVNRFAETHTQDLQNLTEAIRAWGEEQQTMGELTGYRRAVSSSSGDKVRGTAPVRQLRSTS